MVDKEKPENKKEVKKKQLDATKKKELKGKTDKFGGDDPGW